MSDRSAQYIRAMRQLHILHDARDLTVEESRQGVTNIVRIINQMLRMPHKKATIVENTRVLSKKDLDSSCADACAICMEIPKKIDSLATECGHEFCKGCYNGWFTAPNSKKNCPSCRKFNPCVTTYRARAARQKKAPVAPKVNPEPEVFESLTTST